MKKNIDIKKQYKLFSPFLGSAKNQMLKVLFQGKDFQLIYSDHVPAYDFLLDMDIDNGSLLGKGGMKRVFNIDGNAVFLILTDDLVKLKQTIEIEVSISRQMRLVGLQAQDLSSESIGIYDPESSSYLDYPCMVADSFSTLSKLASIEVFDSKNRLRFGNKNILFSPPHDFSQDNLISKEIFGPVLRDMALLLYHGFDYDTDCINIAIMPKKIWDTAPSVRLFLYDFSSKERVTRSCYEPMKNLEESDQRPLDSRIEYLLQRTFTYILEADSLARTNGDSYSEDLNFFQIYPTIKDGLLNEVKAEISILIASSQMAPAEISGPAIKTVTPIMFSLSSPAIKEARNNTNSELIKRGFLLHKNGI